MYIIHSGVGDLDLVRCTNIQKQYYCIVWDCFEEYDENCENASYRYKCEEFNHKPTIEEIQTAVMADHDHEEYDWDAYERYLNNED